MIAGKPAAGCLAALALAQRRPDVPLLIVEEKERFGGEGFRLLFDNELDDSSLVMPMAEHRWPGFYVAFPEYSRNLKAPLAGFAPEALHRTMINTLKPNQYRLGTKVVAVRDDALVLDGGETIKAEGALDARGTANLSMLELLYEARVEREYRFEAPHRVDRPVLIDTTADPNGSLGFIQCIPLSDERLIVADIVISDRALPDGQAPTRLDRYVKLRGWKTAAVEAEHSLARPLPHDGDFGAFWRIGGARVAKLGLRGGFLNPLTGRAVSDGVRTALQLAQQREFSGAALHDLFEEQAKQLWRKRDFHRAVNATLAGAKPAERPAMIERIYRLDAGLIADMQADRLGLLDRRRVQRALKP